MTGVPGIDALSAAILRELASARSDAGMSLPRLGKQLGVGVSVLMRRLSLMGDARIGGAAGPGWVRVTQHDDRWTAALTDVGRALCEAGLSPAAGIAACEDGRPLPAVPPPDSIS